MQSWLDVEQFFQKAGVQFERKDWLYLCHLNGRQFYYSPQTGKWRLQGKKAWQKSQNLQEFITQALNYLATNEQTNQSQNDSQHHQRKKSHQKTKTTSQSSQKHSNERANSSRQHFNSEQAHEIRPEFLSLFGHFLQIQRQKGYKIGWIFYSLLDRLLPTPIEICWLCVVFKYASGWAFYQIKSLYGHANWEAIFKLIEQNQFNWLQDFQSRWGTENNQKYQREKQREKHHRPVGDFPQQVLAYQSYLNLLKISFPFTKQELKSAYRKRALETHPDSGGTAEAFRQLNSAYQFLLGVSH